MQSAKMNPENGNSGAGIRLVLLCLGLVFQFSCQIKTEGPYPTARPITRWWWFASEIQKKDIAAQLDWLSANGFGGVEVAWVYPLNRMNRDTVNYTPRTEWLGESWMEAVRFCKAYGDSLGLSVDFTFGSLWPFGDSAVLPTESVQVFGEPEFRQWIKASWNYPDQWLVLDHLNSKAFEKYASRMGAGLQPAMQTGNPSAIFVDSWEVETRNLWTTGFDSIFSGRFGYSITPYMENNILGNGFEGQRYDYMKLISELVIQNFYRPFTETAHQLGGFSRGQCSGSPTDLITAYSVLDVPESEAMLYEPSYSRIVSSAAALANRPVITAETFTCLYGWPREHLREEKVTDLKIVADALFAHGVNQIIWHGTPYNPIGSDSVSFYASVHIGQAGTLSKHLKDFNTYLTQVSEYMRKGAIYSDVAIYLPLEDAWIAGEMPKEKQLPWAWGEYEFRYQVVPEEIRGWQPLWVNGSFLQEGRWDSTKHTLEAGGCMFNSLYIDSRYLDYEVLITMVSLAEDGLPVCLKQKPEEAGYYQHEDFASMADRLVELSSTDWSQVAPSAPLVEGEDVPYFWCRKEGNRHYIFFAHPVASEFRYPVKYGQADTDRALTRDITINQGDKKIAVRLKFEPYESLLVEVRPGGVCRFIDLPDFRSPTGT